MNKTAFPFFWVIPVIVIFFAGGILQYSGILSQTQSNLLALLFFIATLLQKEAAQQIKNEKVLILFGIFIFLDYFRHNSPMLYTVTYVYYIACSLIAAVAGRVYASRIALSISRKSFFRIAIIFLLVEFLVVAIQRFFTEEFISLSRVPIGDVDAIFGTFFLQSDAALAVVCELLTISTFFFRARLKDRLTIWSLSLAIIYLGNSNAAKVAIVFLFCLTFIYNGYGRLRLGRYGFNVLLFLGAACITVVLYSPMSGLLANFSDQVTSDYYHRESWETASRFSPIGQMLAEGLRFLGQGALTYYNPITKRWLYDAGFSTIYSLYIDFGLVGLVFYFYYQVSLIIKFTRNYFEFFIFLFVAAFFMPFNFALTDLAFVFTFNTILRLNYLCGMSSGQMRYEKNRALKIRHSEKNSWSHV